jgi:tripartite-type tricarboxylate transporter receptor subunit TctC
VTGVAMRRRDLVALLVGMALIAGASPAHDADYPNRSVRVIVPYPAGGPTDLIARLAAQMLTESLGQDFFVENVSGASGVRGALTVAAAPGDGYTLMVATGDLAIAPVMSTKVGYDALKNFVPISIISRSPSVLLLHPSVPAKTVQEFAILARADPAKYSYASMSLGQNLLNTERLFRLTLKLPVVRIPFPGAAPILSSTAAGHTLVAYIGLPPATPFIKEGTLQVGGHQPKAISHRAGRADHGGERSCRPGNGAGDRPGSPGSHAAVDRGPVGAPDGGVRCPAANARAPRSVRLYCGRQYAGGICRPNQIRYRSGGCGCSRGRDQGRLNRSSRSSTACSSADEGSDWRVQARDVSGEADAACFRLFHV